MKYKCLIGYSLYFVLDTFIWAMEKLLIEYKRLKSKLEGEVGCEETTSQLIWNEGILEAMENLIINRQHLFGIVKIIAYICCYKPFKKCKLWKYQK